jgi:peptidylprolyl isomerase
MRRFTMLMVLAVALTFGAAACGTEQAVDTAADQVVTEAENTAAEGAAEVATGVVAAVTEVPEAAAAITDTERAMPLAPAEVDAYVTTASGLQYATIKEGTGDAAQVGDNVIVHYTGWLEDGTMFDSSLKPDRGQPFTFSLGSNNVIPGWEEGVAGMKVGEQRQLRIPPELGYGASDMGTIPPNSTLIFDVELLGIQ